jgi:hypothetical protein
MAKRTPAAMTAALQTVAPLSLIGPLSPKVSVSSCDGYINVDDHCVSSPDHTPGNYHDKDNTNSHSEHRQGSGSWHGGTGKSGMRRADRI